MEPVNTEELTKLILGLKNSAPGHDEILPKFLKLSINCIIDPLLHVCNLSLSNGVFPSELKVAKVVPIFKGGDTTKLTNYRPVSILSVVSKVLERLMYNRMFSFIEKYKILYDYQFGFRIKHSTHMALSLFIDKLTHYIENGEHSIGVYLDFSKAFDTIDHDILYMKLHHYGFRSHVLDWIKSYMSNRCQYVSYNGHDSMMQDISCGVPQGSILGPLLFLLYINDLGNICQNLSAFMFADDTSLLGHDTDISVLKAKVNDDLVIISSWLNANKLSLNLSKSQFMLFTRKHFTLTDINITVNNVCIDRVNKVKFLGTIMDDKLNWQEHITYICKKVSKCIGILYKLRQYVDINTAKLLYYTLVYPYLTYCNIVWGNTFKQYLRPLMVIQKKAVRIIVGNRIF